MKQLTRTLPEMIPADFLNYSFNARRQALGSMLEMADPDLKAHWQVHLHVSQESLMKLDDLRVIAEGNPDLTADQVTDRLALSLGYTPVLVESFMNNVQRLYDLTPTGIRTVIEELESHLEEIEHLEGGAVGVVNKQISQGTAMFLELVDFENLSDLREQQGAVEVTKTMYDPTVMVAHMVQDGLMEVCDKFLKEQDAAA